MKECPVCKAIAFDDAQVCYGCLHRFEPGEGARGDLDAACGKVGSEQSADHGATPGAARTAQAAPTAVCPDAPPQVPPGSSASAVSRSTSPVAESSPDFRAISPVVQAASLSLPASEIVVRIEVVGAAVSVDAGEGPSAASRIAADQACALLRRSGPSRGPVTPCPAEEGRGVSAGHMLQGAAEPTRGRARHAAKGEREVVVA